MKKTKFYGYPVLIFILSVLLSLTIAGQALGAGAITLPAVSATMSQTGDTEWTLEKTGEVDTANSTVTWSITGIHLAPAPR